MAKSTFVDTFAEAVVSVAKESLVVAVTESVFGVIAGEPVVAGFRVIELDVAAVEALGFVRSHNHSFQPTKSAFSSRLRRYIPSR